MEKTKERPSSLTLVFLTAVVKILFVGRPAWNPDDMDKRLHRGANKRKV